MSILTGKKIHICNREFGDYRDLASYMRSILVEYVNKTGMIDNDFLLKALKAFKECLFYGKNGGAYVYLLKERFPIACLNLMKFCIKNGDFKLFSALLSCIITITDNSPQICEELVKNGLSEILIKETIRVCNSNSETLPKSLTKESLFDQLILIVDNIASDPRFQQSFLNCEDIVTFKTKILPFMKSKDDRTRILTMTALTYLIGGDEDKTRLDFFSTIIDDFVIYINKGMKDKSRRCEGLRISEMLVVLKYLANIESIKNAMLGMKNVMTLLTNVVKSDKSTSEDIKEAASIIYNLSFRNVSETEGKKIRIQDVCDVDVIIKCLKETNNPPIKKCVDGLVSEINEKTELKNIKIHFDIFISCCNTDKDKIYQIADILTEQGFKVVNVQENNKEVEDNYVKKSIEQSRVLVMGVSNSYYNDQYCRAECQHAYKMKKPIIPLIMEAEYNPKDWLEKIIRNETKIDFSNPSKFDSLVTKLLSLIDSTFNRPGVGKACQSKLSSEKRTVGVSKSYQKNKNIKEWNTEEVAQWLQDNGLSNILLNAEVKYDGKMIEYMRGMRCKSNEQYLKRLRDDLKLSFDDEIKFDDALENLKTK